MSHVFQQHFNRFSGVFSSHLFELEFSSAELSATFRGLLPLPFPLPLKPNLSKRVKSHFLQSSYQKVPQAWRYFEKKTTKV
jgi:hypothetical protein